MAKKFMKEYYDDKIFSLVNRYNYDKFKKICKDEGRTVYEVLDSLITRYVEATGESVKKKSDVVASMLRNEEEQRATIEEKTKQAVDGLANERPDPNKELDKIAAEAGIDESEITDDEDESPLTR